MSETVDLRHRLGPPRDQGTRPTCLAFAMSDAHGAALGHAVVLAADYAHYGASRRERATMNQPVSTASMREALEHDGQPPEAACPYCVPRADSWSPPAALTPLWKRPSALLKGTPSLVLRTALAASRAHVLTLAVTESFYRPHSTTFEVADDSSSVVGEHAVVVVAARHDTAGKGECFLVRNSWGPDWGVEGHAWLPGSYVDAQAIDIVEF